MAVVRCFIILLIICGFFATAPSAFARGNFETALHTTYTVSAAGNTLVQQLITITNKTPTQYVTQYGLKISSATIKDVHVTSEGKEIPAEVVSGHNLTSIGITFPENIVGEGKSRTLEI